MGFSPELMKQSLSINIPPVKLFYFDMVSWDVAINKNNKPKIIEINLSGQEINFHQFSNGPLFGDYTEQIISKLHKIKRSFK